MDMTTPPSEPTLHGPPPGTLDMMILSLLAQEPLHGYLIARRIEERSGGVLGIEEGSLYPAMQRLRKRRAVTAEWATQESGREVRIYTITREGRAELAQAAARWRTVAAAVDQIIRSVRGGPNVRFA